MITNCSNNKLLNTTNKAYHLFREGLKKICPKVPTYQIFFVTLHLSKSL